MIAKFIKAAQNKVLVYFVIYMAKIRHPTNLTAMPQEVTRIISLKTKLLLLKINLLKKDVNG